MHKLNIHQQQKINLITEAAIQRWSCQKVFWKNAANLQENTHAEVQFQ